MVVTNHPLGSAAGTEMLAAGGNAIDAAVAALLTLTVVEPMMVGIAGGGISHLRLADGTHVVIDALASAARSMHPAIYTPVSDDPTVMDVAHRRNTVGASAVAVPGNLAGWCHMHRKWGTLPFADLVEPAIRAADRGFLATHYLAGAVAECAADLVKDAALRAVLMPDDQAPKAGERIFMRDYAESLRLIATDGERALHGGALGAALAARMTGEDAGWITLADLENYSPIERDVISSPYRGYEIVGPPPPASSGVHIAQMLNILEGFDIAAMGFDATDTLDLLARTIALAFEDRRAASGDPAFVDVPVARLISKAYAAECRARLGRSLPGTTGPESQNTTHVTIADKAGNIVSATHTINGLFGARIMVPGTGIIPNNYMMNYDPRPGRAMSIEPGKRVPTSMAPMIVCQNGFPRFALGLPGGLRIFPSALQAIVNLIDHGMSLQEAVEAPRIWTEGADVEVETPFEHQKAALESKGHNVKVMPHIGGGMNAIAFHPDGMMEGAACWRADGTALALGGGLARPGVRFWPDRAPEDAAMTASGHEPGRNTE